MDRFPGQAERELAVYDYIIVGAGSAGCVLASRLSENPGTRVLLLEAGPPDTADQIRMPAAASQLFKTAYDWDYQTEVQDRAGGRSVFWPRGRVIGGSSSINSMIYLRGNRHDFDTWRDDYGCEGWGYTDLLPYFLRAESNSRGASAYHGSAGPVSVQDLRYKSSLSGAFIDAAKSCGLPRNDDFNGPAQDGVGYYQVTQRGGRRWSAADAYLHPAMTRPNLTVETDALVTGVVIEAGRANGVRYLRRGVEEAATADAEVILCAGAVGSPQLLMLSGVGPAAHLHDHNIAVMAENPGVGGNLSDHPVVPAMWAAPKTRSLREKSGAHNLARWQMMHTGPMTTNIAEAGGFTRTDPALAAPDIQWLVLPVPFVNGGLADASGRALSVLVTLAAVGSRGRIRLRSSDPRHKPAIDPSYLADSADLDPLVQAVSMARDFAAARPLRRVARSELAPGEQVRSDAELRDWVRHNLGTGYDPVGTCAMGGDGRVAVSKLTSVVDIELRVRGVQALRVVDASIMPTVPRGNTGAPVIAIAERAADLIQGRAPLVAIDPADMALAASA
jgi:choline dehydrogenase